MQSISARPALADVETLTRYAHKYWAQVYVTLNTLLYDDELAAAVDLAHQLYKAGVDALIVQDVGQVVTVDKRSFRLEPGAVPLHNGDGLCFFDSSGTLCGGKPSSPTRSPEYKKACGFIGITITCFWVGWEKSRAKRKITVRLKLKRPEGFSLSAIDEDGNTATGTLVSGETKANKPEKALASSQTAIVRTPMFLTGAMAICMVIFGLTDNFWLAATVYCLSITLRITSDPILRTWTNQNTESSVRATILSMDAQVNSLGQMMGGPAIGAIGTAISLPVALVTTGLARVPVTMLFAQLVLQVKRKGKCTRS